VPVEVTGLTAGVTAISSKYEHTCAIANGSAVCWGANYYGAMGNGKDSTAQHYSSVPVQVDGLTSGVQAIAAGDYHACATANGQAFCWGHGESGELGDDTATTRLVPVAVAGLTSGVTNIVAGSSYSCASSPTGLSCWGSGNVGRLGTGNTESSSHPVSVVGISTDTSVLTAGWQHACAVVSGCLMCWGTDERYELGNHGASTCFRTPCSATPVLVGF
jgi:alpha-tubulin suppressor-like RCC1 family protein